MSEKEFKLKEFYSIRIQLFKVKKSFFGWKDELLGHITVIQINEVKAISLLNKIDRLCKKEGGVEFKIE